MSPALKEALADYLSSSERREGRNVITTERSDRFSAHAVVVFFSRLYKKLGFTGVSSHSGRRSFCSRAARRIFHAGGSLRDVQALMGHRHLSTTQRYIEQDIEAQRKVVCSLYGAMNL